jgi:tetratricopeptide (TPR) repeat protein
MSNRFTRATLAAGLVTALLQGCAAPGGAAGDAVAASSAVPDAAAGQAVPEVRGENARAFAAATEALQGGRLVEAETLLLEITEDQPELAGPWINLSEVYLARGRDDEARSALSRAVAANPRNCAARTELGVLLRRQGEFAAAEAQYRACLESAPDYQPAYLNLGILYELYLGRFEEALEAYRGYQRLASEPDARVAGWVVDLERRLGV